jgi:hypothetical protein
LKVTIWRSWHSRQITTISCNLSSNSCNLFSEIPVKTTSETQGKIIQGSGKIIYVAPTRLLHYINNQCIKQNQHKWTWKLIAKFLATSMSIGLLNPNPCIISETRLPLLSRNGFARSTEKYSFPSLFLSYTGLVTKYFDYCI